MPFSNSDSNSALHLGILNNRTQFALQLTQIFLVGLTIGMMRVVIPGLAESEFGLANQAFFLLASFVVVFGLIKALMNLYAGKLSEQYGRKRILIWGWLIALPIPFLLLYAQSWNWIIFATILLGLNQGLAWSMALNSKLDLARTNQKGLVNGLNEFSGYAAVGIAGVLSAYFAEAFGAKEGLFIFSFATILLGLFIAIFAVQETLPWARLHHSSAPTEAKSLGELFKFASLQDRQLIALNQAGLVEKFTDAIIWVFLPVYLLTQSISLLETSGIIAVYGLVWGSSQLITGPLSDKIGRKVLVVWGMWLCGLGVLLIPQTDSIVLLSIEAAVIGLGMGMLYPNLGAAVGDFAPANHRASLIGVYRFWRDFGYAVGALIMGLLAQFSQSFDSSFWFVGLAMILSGLWVQISLPKGA